MSELDDCIQEQVSLPKRHQIQAKNCSAEEKETDQLVLRDVEGWLLGGGRVPGKRGGAGGKAGSAVGRRPSLMGGDGGLTVSESEQGKWNKMEI